MGGPHAGQPLISPIAHPELKTLSQANIHTFLRDRETYLLRLQDAQNATTGTLNPVSVKSSIKQDLLISLIDGGAFDDEVDTLEDLSEDILTKWLQDRDEVKLESLTLEQLEKVIASRVKINTREPNASIRIWRLIADYQTVLREKKWDHIIKKSPKVAVAHICELLQPPELKNKVENDLKLGKNELRKSWKPFIRYLTKQAEACENFVPIRTVHTRRNQNQDKSARNDDGPVNSSRRTRDHSSKKRSKEVQEKSANQYDSDDSDHAPKQLPFCLNEDCRKQRKRHFIKDCKDTSEDEKQRLIAEFRKKRQQAPARRPGLRVLSVEERDEENSVHNGIFKATLADTLVVDLNGDYGSDHAALSVEHVESLHKKGVFVPMLSLPEPIVFEVALEGKDLIFKAHKKARISTTIPTAGGPLRLRNVQYLVVDEKISHVLLSRPLLKELGFNLEHHLAEVRNRFNDADFSHIGFSSQTCDTNGTLESHSAPTVPSKLSRLLLHSKKTSEPSNIVDQDETASQSDSSDDNDSPEECDSFQPHSLPSFYGENLDDDTSSSRYDVNIEVGKNTVDEMTVHLSNLQQDAIDHGLPPDLHERLRILLQDYKDIFRDKMGADGPLQVAPMVVELRPDARPIRVRARRYSPAQTEFLRAKVDELLTLGLVRVNTTSKWACVPHIVHKDGPERFRFTVDLRPVNNQTEPYIWPMPDVEGSVAKLKQATCYASIDLCHFYWQLPLHPDSQECQSFITPDGVYSPTRVLHGQTNATATGQAAIQNLCEQVRDNMLQWIDDLLFHERTPVQLLEKLAVFFGICKEYNLKLHVRKCHLFLKEVKWCGRIISEEGIRLDPRRFKALTEMENPVTAADLQQFVCGANWMRTVIPDFNRKVHNLATFLEKIYNVTGKRTKTAMTRIKLADHGWTATETNALKNMKLALVHSVTLAHPDVAKLLCLFTDASEFHWSAVLTQIPPPDKDLPFDEQRHEPLAFLSGSFTGSSFRWSTPEKEAFAIVEAVTKLDYIVLRPHGFMIFTDHKNLTYLFNPVAVQPNIAKHVANKLERWAMRLCHFRYEIVHISGDDNVWADLLSRWGAPHTNMQEVHPLSMLLRAPVSPELDPELRWPDASDIFAAEQKYFDQERGTSLGTVRHEKSREGVVTNETGAAWIPDSSVKLQLRILVVGHCGRAGHRGTETTYNGIKGYFFWSTLEQDVTTFVNTCLHCLSTIGGNKVPRPFGHTIHSDKPNELIHFDFLYAGESEIGMEYVFIIKDDASMYTWLEAYSSADAVSACNLLLRWFAAFGTSPNWMSDRGPHFMNTLMTTINRSLHTNHHFTTPHHPQSNGTVESVCREVLRAIRSLRSEFRIRQREWPVLLPIVQSVLNNSTRRSLNGQAPVTVFTGLPADSPLRTIIHPRTSEEVTISELSMRKKAIFDRFMQALDHMHKEVAEKRTRTREQAIKKHNQNTGVQDINFQLGDYVLVGLKDGNKQNKLLLKWRGPRRITKVISDLTFEVEDLISKKHSIVHADRLKFYAESSLNVTEELLDTIDHNHPHYNTVTKLLGLRYNSDLKLFQVQCRWRGFGAEEPTWEPLAIMHEDIPDMLD